MIDAARHRPLLPLAWDAAAAEAAIEEIVADALGAFDPISFWPAHPQDDGVEDGETSLYFGPAGMVWALDYLARVGATTARPDFRAVLPRLLAANTAAFARMNYAAHGSLLFGDMGTALVAMRIAPSPATADLVFARAEANTALPIRELMWGLPGSLLAALHMDALTGEPRWRRLFEAQAARLIDALEDTPDGRLWTQDLYGQHRQWLGPVHGFAGNMIPLLRGWHWLSELQQTTVAEAATRTLALTALTSETGATWPPQTRPTRPVGLCQHCHGAPGMVITFAAAPFASVELDALMLAGGAFTWAAGPLTKGSNLCHGTGGNGYAFLRLYERTGEEVWLERARVFAMNAIGQWREAREAVGRGRYSLWTGDVGLAVYLWDCGRGVGAFPTVDVV